MERIAWDQAPWQGKKGKKLGEKECKNNWEANEVSQTGDQGKGKDAISFPPKSPARLAWLADFFFALSILFFAFYPTKEPGTRLGEELNRKEIEATYAAAKKNPEKQFRLIQDSNILPMQLECCTSISQWFKSCTSQTYSRLSFVASVPEKIFFAFKIILISTQ